MENKQFMTLKDLKDKGIPYKIVRLTKEERLRKEEEERLKAEEAAKAKYERLQKMGKLYE